MYELDMWLHQLHNSAMIKTLLDGKTQWKYNDDEEIETAYAKVPVSLLHRKDISAKAKCVFAYMTSKTATYQFASKRIADHFQEGYRTILHAIKELADCGYINKKRLPTGRMFYEVKENYWSLTTEEGKESLMDAFTDAFKRPVHKYDPVTLKEAQKQIEAIVANKAKAWELTMELLEQCRNAEMSVNEKTLASWIKHIKSGALS